MVKQTVKLFFIVMQVEMCENKKRKLLKGRSFQKF